METARDLPEAAHLRGPRSPPAPPTSSRLQLLLVGPAAEQVAERGQGEGTTLDGAGDVLADEREVPPVALPVGDRAEQVLEPDLVEAEQQLDLGPGRGLEDPVGLHEEALVVDEGGVAHERLDDSRTRCALSRPALATASSPVDELLVREGVVAEHLARAVVAHAEHRALTARRGRPGPAPARANRPGRGTGGPRR